MKFTKEELIRQFDIKYIPYLVDDYEVPELRREDIPLDEENPLLRDITYNVDQKRKEDIYVGVNGKAQKVKGIYVGVNGKAREVYKST